MKSAIGPCDTIFPYDPRAPVLHRLDRLHLPYPRGTASGKPGAASAIARPAHQTIALPNHCMAQSVLGRLAKALVRLETTARPGYTQDGGSLASRRLSALLEMDLARQTNGRQEACEPACSGSDRSHGH